MVCIYCGSATSVTNSRHQKGHNAVWRRRHCPTCGATFTTIEQADLLTSILVRDDTKRVAPFSRDQLFIDMYEACRHRPSNIADASALTATICAQVLKTVQDGTIDKTTIAQIAGAVLEHFDAAAATMYRAYHPSAA